MFFFLKIVDLNKIIDNPTKKAKFMELIGQRAKEIMEECKVRAKKEGLSIQGETLEYIVTNQDMIELSPKIMIPTLYDYWVNDVEIVRDKWIYGIYPRNPYETCVNTRPAISFFNDNNADWLNTMIFYHVLGHIDFFQNNVFFRRTWDDDFCGQALADKRLINKIREEMGSEKRWVDYVIEFARSIDNLVGFYAEFEDADRAASRDVFGTISEKANFYFGEFLKRHYEKNFVELKFYYDELERYNKCLSQFEQKMADAVFFQDPVFVSKFPEFLSAFKKYEDEKKKKVKTNDILQYLIEHSPFMKKEENKWMKDVMEVVRRTSLYFQPQIRTKIANEGWASFWHERLFVSDEKMSTHEVDFAKVNSGVLADRKLGLNPYIVGKRLFEFIEELSAKGKLSYEYRLIKDLEQRKKFDRNPGSERKKEALFSARINFNDFMLINFLSDDDFQDFVDRHNLFVAGQRLNEEKDVIEIFIKSRDGKEYRELLNDSLYHPPNILISREKCTEEELYIEHIFEGRTLVTRYIPAVLTGLSYLYGGKVILETTEFEIAEEDKFQMLYDPEFKPEYKKVRVRYVYGDKKVQRSVISEEQTEGSL